MTFSAAAAFCQWPRHRMRNIVDQTSAAARRFSLPSQSSTMGCRNGTASVLLNRHRAASQAVAGGFMCGGRLWQSGIHGVDQTLGR